jgi:hypothetical protein
LLGDEPARERGLGSSPALTTGLFARTTDHSEIKVVSRDRGGGYGEAAAKALPDVV